MRFSLRSAILPVCVGAVLALGFTECGRENKPGTEATDKSGKSYQTQLWVKYKDIPPGADPSVPAEMGGNGFEKIADSLGYVTYSAPEADLPYFGDPRAKVGGEIHTTISRFPLTFRVMGQNSNFVENSMIQGMVYQSLLGTHPLNYDYVPQLASHWMIGADKMTFRYRIDPNARFADGKPVTSEDVVATWKLAMDETILDPSMQLTYGKLEQPVAISKYIVEVKAKSLNWRNFFYFSLALPILPAHEIGNITGQEFLTKYEFTMPTGSGEYAFLKGDIEKGQAYTFTRRDDWWQKDDPMYKYTGNFDRISFEVVKDNPTLEYEKFKKGDQDAFLFTGLTTEQWLKDKYEALDKGWVQKRRVYTNAPMGTNGYAFNLRKPPFDDIRVRTAFALLHNRDAIIEKLLYNEYTLTNSYYSNSVYENPNNPVLKYDPARAQQLLAEAGWKTKNGQGILVKNGKPFVLEMGIPKVIEKFVTPYQQELRKVGIDLQIKLQDGNTLFQSAMDRNFSIYWISWGGLQVPNPETSLNSKLADQKDNNNLEGFKNARVDELCRIYDTTFTRARQLDIIREVDSIAMSMHHDALGWNPKGIRIIYWDKFGMPDYVLPRFTSLGQYDAAIIGSWWYDADKAKALEEAMKSKKALPVGKTDVMFWKEFKDKQ